MLRATEEDFWTRSAGISGRQNNKKMNKRNNSDNAHNNGTKLQTDLVRSRPTNGWADYQLAAKETFCTTQTLVRGNRQRNERTTGIGGHGKSENVMCVCKIRPVFFIFFLLRM